MVYLAGGLGFVCGFFAGQTLLFALLRDYSKLEILEMMKDRGARFKYGILNWSIAGGGALLFVYIYNNYFAGN